MPTRITAPTTAPVEHAPIFEAYETMLGFVPETARTMGRVPGLLEAYAGLGLTVVGNGLLPETLIQLIANVTSAAAGCRYCQAHTAAHAEHLGVDADKLAELWSYETSPLFSDAERAALTLADHAGQHPNAATDADFDECRKHYDDDQITAIIAVCAFFGFLNRWNDTLATTLEPSATEAAERLLSHQGWSAGKHGDR